MSEESEVLEVYVRCPVCRDEMRIGYTTAKIDVLRKSLSRARARGLRSAGRIADEIASESLKHGIPHMLAAGR